ncbi:MAG TPA: hypothetical protein VES39_01905 [Rhodospirillales bacterium]|nr:hypothetical protein [Rhodospirillales bacterium]
MDDLSIARALHVLSVVLWIGGVGLVTTVLLPAIGKLRSPGERYPLFEAIEGRFARQARASTLLVGISGFYIAWAQDLWDRFLDPAFWWMHAMVAVWLLFSVMLFVLEPLWLHRWFTTASRERPEQTFRLIVVLHRILLAVSLITVAGAVAGSHGAGFWNG